MIEVFNVGDDIKCYMYQLVISRLGGYRSLLRLVPAGGAAPPRPLLLHGSIAATETGRRRTIHLEFAAERLPEGLEWRESGVSERNGCGEK